jgi:hypothetical protein
MRAIILRALYTVLLGNPTLKKRRGAPMRTRFKTWYRLVGSAVEYAAKLANPDYEVDFQKLFLTSDDEDEDSTSLADALAIMTKQWPMAFDAAEVARLVNDQANQHGAAMREFLYPGVPTFHVATPKSVAKRLKNHLDEPVKCGERTLILRRMEDLHNKTWRYSVERSGG